MSTRTCKKCDHKGPLKDFPTSGQYYEKRREWRIFKHYGLTLEEYNQMYDDCGGACEICHKELDVLYIDHDHNTGRVRGLLCSQCNTGIGGLQDDVGLLLHAVRYLETK